MKEKFEKARQCMIRQLMFISPSEFGDMRGTVINDIANSLADSYEEYMNIWNYLQCNF